MAGGRRFATTVAAVLLSFPAWAQSDKPLDLRIPPPGAPSAGGSVCTVCGEIRSIREVNVGRRAPVAPGASSSDYIGSRPGTDDWRVVGPVAILPIGPGTKDEGWRVGSVGTPEMQAQFGESSYEITVLMDSGDRRSVQRRDGSRFQVGQRVRVRSGELEAMFP